MSDQELKTLIDNIKKTILTDDKKNLLSDAMSKYKLTCSQAKEILDQFTISFEKKIMLSEYIAQNLTDPENLDICLETFDFDLDRKMMKRAIRIV